jgi:thiol-disulfide isomerase/thioredoxin
VYRIVILLFLIIASGGLLSAQPALIKWDKMEQLLHPENDTLYVINFWATWCKPCIEELPAFVGAENDLRSEKVRFIYISMDFKREFNTRFIPFVEQHLKGRTVYLLDEPDYNAWISKVNDQWQGEIPATLLIRNHPAVSSFQNSLLSSSELLQLLKFHL